LPNQRLLLVSQEAATCVPHGAGLIVSAPSCSYRATVNDVTHGRVGKPAQLKNTHYANPYPHNLLTPSVHSFTMPAILHFFVHACLTGEYKKN
jgi:hypothetical protein